MQGNAHPVRQGPMGVLTCVQRSTSDHGSAIPLWPLRPPWRNGWATVRGREHTGSSHITYCTSVLHDVLPRAPQIDAYSAVVTHEVIRVAVLETVEKGAAMVPGG